MSEIPPEGVSYLDTALQHKSKKAKPNPYSEMMYLDGLHRQLSEIVTNAMTEDLTEIDPLPYIPGPDTVIPVIPFGSTRTALNISVTEPWSRFNKSGVRGSLDIANFSILVPISKYFPSYDETISSHQNLVEDVNKCIGTFPSSFAKAATKFLSNPTLIHKLRNIVDSPRVEEQIDKFFEFDVPAADYYVTERLRDRAKDIGETTEELLANIERYAKMNGNVVPEAFYSMQVDELRTAWKESAKFIFGFGLYRPLDPSEDEIKAMTNIETRQALTLQYRFAIKPCIARSILAECQTNPTPKSLSMKAITTNHGVVCIALDFYIDIEQNEWKSKIHEAVSGAMGGGDGLVYNFGEKAHDSEDNGGGD